MPLTAMETALQGSVVTLFYAYRFTLPGGVSRLLDGAGRVEFDGAEWTGLDATFGALASVDVSSDGIATAAPELRLSVLPPNLAAAAILCDPANQGARVEMFEGLVDKATGAVIGEPDLKFDGEIDVPTLRVGKAMMSVEIVCVSVWERLFEQEEGARLSDAFHQAAHPGELGFALITSVKTPPIWGADSPRPTTTLVTASSGGGLGGGRFDNLDALR